MLKKSRLGLQKLPFLQSTIGIQQWRVLFVCVFVQGTSALSPWKDVICLVCSHASEIRSLRSPCKWSFFWFRTSHRLALKTKPLCLECSLFFWEVIISKMGDILVQLQLINTNLTTMHNWKKKHAKECKNRDHPKTSCWCWEKSLSSPCHVVPA